MYPCALDGSNNDPSLMAASSGMPVVVSPCLLHRGLMKTLRCLHDNKHIPHKSPRFAVVQAANTRLGPACRQSVLSYSDHAAGFFMQQRLGGSTADQGWTGSTACVPCQCQRFVQRHRSNQGEASSWHLPASLASKRGRAAVPSVCSCACTN